MPGGDPTLGAVHGTLGGRTRAAATKFLLRDHAPPQPRGSSVLAAKRGRGDGAHVAARRAGFWPHRPGVVAPADAPPASGGPGAGIRGPGSNAGSNAAAGTGVHSLCAGRRAAAVVGNGSVVYHDDSPRERILPRDSSGRTGKRSPRAIIKSQQPCYTSVHELDRKRNGLRNAGSRRREPDNEGNSLRKLRQGDNKRRNALAFSKRSQLALFFRPVSISPTSRYHGVHVPGGDH